MAAGLGAGEGAKPAAGSWKILGQSGASGGANSTGISWKPAFAANFLKIWSRGPAEIARPAAMIRVSRRHNSLVRQTVRQRLLPRLYRACHNWLRPLHDGQNRRPRPGRAHPMQSANGDNHAPK